MLMGNNGGNLLPYMIHCTWSEKRPEELHQPARFWGVLRTYKRKKGLVIMKACETTDIRPYMNRHKRAGQNIEKKKIPIFKFC